MHDDAPGGFMRQVEPVRAGGALGVEEAWNASPDMAQLSARIHLSQALLKSIQPLLPLAMSKLVHAGPVTDMEWCLLVHGNAASAKLRQLLPDLKQRVRESLGRELDIRIKVLQNTS